MLSVVAAALLIAVPSCINNSNDATGPVTPKPERACLEFGDPERTSTINISTPRKGQLLNPESDVYISWVVEEVRNPCGDAYVTVQATYHNNPHRVIVHKEMVAEPANGNYEKYRLPNLAEAVENYGSVTCDLVCFWVTVNDDLGPVGEPELVAVGPLTARPTPHRIPQDRTEP